MRAILVLVVVGCGSVSDPNHIIDARPADTACVPETDTAFCTRVAKCEMFTAPDNCGQARSADCGACTGTNACVSNVCKPPVCGATFQGAPGTTVPSVLAQGRQTALTGASTSGQSILYLQTVPGVACGNFVLTIADEAVAGSPPYVAKSLGQVTNLNGFSKAEETLILAPDGLTIIGAAAASQSFLESKRSAIGMTDFSLAAAGDFATLNTGIPASPASLSWPVLSADGLAFYYHVAGATDTTKNGEYEALRTSTAMAFPVGTMMPAAVQAFVGISGMSTDRMTAFMATASFGTQILTRTSLSQPFTVPTSGTPPGSAYRVMPIAGCTAIGTCEPGGCNAEDVCTWTNN